MLEMIVDYRPDFNFRVAYRRMKRKDLIEFLLDRIVERKKQAKPLRVSIDGRCASGKTTLADEIASIITIKKPGLEVLRASVDGFHHPREHRYRQGEYSATGYYEDAFNYTAVIECVLDPLSRDHFPVKCKQVSHNVRTDMPDDAPPIFVGANAVLLFDGIFLGRRELDSYWDLRILVDVDADTSIARAVRRDAAASELGEVEKKYRVRYEPAWQIYLEKDCPAPKAHLIVHNVDIANPTVSCH
jgi:uridine kinase